MTQAINSGLPLIVACSWALLLIVVEMFSGDRRFVGVAWMGVIGLAVTAAMSVHYASVPAVYGNALALDGYAVYFNLLACTLGAAAMLLSIDYLGDAGIVRGEYYSLMFFAVIGVVIMAAATDLIVMFIGLETMSMAVYVLAGIRKSDLRSNEAALKYFLLGALASALLLYGVALLYTITGSTVLADVSKALSDTQHAGASRCAMAKARKTGPDT